MQIAYINKGKIKAKSSNDKILEQAYSKDIRICYNKNKARLHSLGIDEIEFIAMMKREFNKKKGIYSK
jgi:hypothetical protein